MSGRRPGQAAAGCNPKGHLSIPKVTDGADISRTQAANRAKCQRYRLRLQAQVLAAYGTVCACCGSTERLTIDHIDGRGREHRLQLYGRVDRGGQHFWLWLIRAGFPEGYQTLCNRCNVSKQRGVACRLQHLPPGGES